jgi:hypothetical protein
MPSPPHSHTNDSESRNQAPTAKVEEWPLGQAVLKRTVINGSATFQIQFTWEPCMNEQAGASTVSHRAGPPRSRAPRAMTKGKRGKKELYF